MVPRMTRGITKYLQGDWMNVLSVLLVSIVLLSVAFGDLFIPYSTTTMDLAHRLEPPSHIHLFGTDEFGRDVFSRVISGTKFSVMVAIIVLIVASVVGSIVGCLAGLLGAWADEILMRMTDIFLAFPALVLAIAVAATLGPSLKNALIALSIVYWPWYARLVRAQVLSLRKREYVIAARCLGVTTPHLIRRHLLPDLLPIVITQLSLEIGTVILSIAGLSFLGLGAQPPTPEWGTMILTARQFMRESWWCAAFPGLALALTCLGFNLLGDSLCDYLDPRLRA